jgi:hypothetical protein
VIQHIIYGGAVPRVGIAVGIGVHRRGSRHVDRETVGNEGQLPPA